MIQRFIVLLLVGIFVFLHHPSWLLCSSLVSRLSARGGVHWEGLRIDGKTIHWYAPRIRISWNAMTVHTETIDARVRAGEIEASLNLLHLPPVVSEIGPVKIPAQFIEVRNSSEPEAKAPEKKSSSGIKIPSWIRPAKLEDVDVTVEKLKIPGDSGSVTLRHVGGSDLWNLSVKERVHRAQIKVAARNTNRRVDGDWHLLINGKAKKVSPQIRRAKLEACKIDLTQGGREAELTTHCPLALAGRLPGIREASGIKTVGKLHVLLVSTLRSRDFLDTRRKIRGDIALQLLPMDPLIRPAHLLKAWGTLHLAVDGAFAQPLKQWKAVSTLDLRLLLPRFGKLVRLLDHTKYAVIAPFHDLKGSLLLSVRGQVDAKHADAPMFLKTSLHSPNQNFDVDLDGRIFVHQFSPTFRSELQGRIVLTNVRIPLPHVDYKALPRILPDPRIHPGKPQVLAKTGQAAGEAPSFEYHLKVLTQQQPVRIVSNLTNAPVPVRLNLNLDSGAPMTGTIHLDPFPLNLFHRDAKIDHVDIEMTPKEQKLSGMAKVEYTDYTIQVLLFGTLDEPGVKFVSDPPLSDQDVISVLLFGRTSEDLDSGEGQSVGNVQSAVANRSLDLASLYLLASTPVESVGYDPQSGTVSVKFKLAQGTSLNVAGAQQELESIGLRQRIGKRWALTTQYGNPADPTDHTVSTFLEWHHRY